MYINRDFYKKTLNNIETAVGMNSEMYTCKKYAKIENEKVFDRCWVCVGNIHELNDDTNEISRIFGDKNIVLKYYGNNSNNNNDSNVKCYYNNNEINLKIFLSSIWVNFNINNMDESNKLWEYQMGDIFQLYGHYPWNKMKILLSKVYDINANWKLITDNFCESYHVTWVHPELFQITNVGLYKENQYNGQYMGVIQTDLNKGRKLFDDENVYFSDLNNVDYDRGYFIHLFPNISYFIFPHHIVTLNTFPNINNPSKCIEIMNLLVRNDINNNKNLNEMNELMRFYNCINNEDINACESCQIGLESNIFKGGRYSGKFELGLHRFHNILIDYLTDNYMKPYPPNYPNNN